MARGNKVIRDSDREYTEFKACEAQDFPHDQKAKTLVVSCIPCNKRAELPIDDAILTFDRVRDGRVRHIQLDEFIAYPHILCRDCLGAASVEVV